MLSSSGLLVFENRLTPLRVTTGALNSADYPAVRFN